MPKTIRGNIGDAVNDVMKNISIETTNLSENTKETKENTKAKKENTEKKKESKSVTKEFNELLKQQQQALSSLNDSIQKQTKMINLQTDAMQKQVEVLKNLVEQKGKLKKFGDEAEEKEVKTIQSGSRKLVSEDGSKTQEVGITLKPGDITKSLLDGTEAVNTHIQNMFVKIKEVNGEIKDVSLNFSKVNDEIKKSEQTLKEVASLLSQQGLDEEAIKSQEEYKKLSNQIEVYKGEISNLQDAISKEGASVETFGALNSKIGETTEKLKTAKEEAEKLITEMSNSGNTMDDIAAKLKEVDIDFNKFSFKGESNNVTKYADELGRVLTVTKEITSTGKENFTYQLSNNFGTLSSSAEKTYNKVQRLNEGINSLRKTAETKKAEGLKQEIDDIYDSMVKLEIKITEASSQSNTKLVNDLTEEYGRQKQKLDELSQSFREVNAQIRNQGGWMLNLKDSWTKAMRSFTTYMSVTTVFYQAIRAIKSMVDEVKELDKSLTEFKKVSDLSGESLEKYVAKAYEAGEVVAKTGREMIDAATSFKKSGYTEEMALQLGTVANMYTNIADEAISAADSADFIIAQLKAFNLETGNATETLQNAYHVIDAVNEVANNFAVSSADIASNLGRASAVMANAGNSLEEMIGLMTAGTEITRNATKVANGLKTITLRLQGMNDEGEKDLEVQAQMEGLFNKLGLSVYKANGELKNTYEILGTLAEVYPKLTNAEKAYVTETIAGKFQAQNAAAILNNWKTAVDATSTALDSNGSAVRENEKVLESIEGYIQRLRSEWEKLSTAVVDGDFIKAIVNIGTQLLKMLNSLAKFSKTTLGSSLLQATALTLAFTKLSKALALIKFQNIATEGLSFKSILILIKSEINVLRGSIKLYGKEAGIAKYATMKFKGALDFLKAHPIVMAIGAITAALVALKYNFDATKKSMEDFLESADDLESKSASLDDMSSRSKNANREEQKQIMKELVSLQKELNEKYKTNITLLKNQDNSKLEEQLKTTKEILENKKKEAALDFLGDNKKYGGFGNALGLATSNLDVYLEIFKGKNPFKELKKRVQDYVDDYKNTTVEAILNSNDDIRKAIEDFASKDFKDNKDLAKEWDKFFPSLKKMLEKGGYSEDQKDAINEYVWDIWGQFYKSSKDAEKEIKFDEVLEKYKKHIDDFVEKYTGADIYTEGVKEIFDQIEGEDGHIDDELSKKFPAITREFINMDTAAKEAGLTFDEFADKLDGLKKISPQDILEDYSTKLDGLKGQYDKLSSAVDEYNEQGFLSLSTLQDIMDSGLLEYLDFENGKLVANTKNFNNMAEAQRNAASAALADAMSKDFAAIADGRLSDASLTAQAAVRGLGNTSETSGNQANNAAGKFITFAAAVDQANKALSGREITGDIQKQIDAVKNAYQKAWNVISKPVKFGGKAKGSGGSGGSSKSQWEIDLENLNNSYKNSEITIEQYITKLEKLRKKYKKNKDAVKELDKAIRDAKLEKLEDDYKRGLISVKKYIAGLKELQKAYKQGTKEWNNFADKIKKGLETLVKDKNSDMKKAQDAAVQLIEDELDNLDKLKDETEKYYDDLIAAKEKANDETERELELARLQEALENAKRNKTKRVYVQGMGWQWMADEQAIADAQKALDDFNNEQEIADLEAQKEEAVKALEEQINSLEEYRDKWKNIADEYEKEQNRLILAQQMGATAEEDILNQRIEILENFKNQYLAILRDLEKLENATGDDAANGKIGLETVPGYAEGGVIDYTGLAKLHGTSNKPEIVLNNAQAANLYSMLKRPQTSPIKFGGGGSTQVYNFDNLVLPNVTNARQFLNELRTITNINKNL